MSEASPGSAKRSKQSGEELRLPAASLPQPTLDASARTVQIERERERFAVLYEVGNKVLSASSFEDLEDFALRLVLDTLNAERGALLLRDETTGEMTVRASRHRGHGALAPGDLPVPTSIVREVVDAKVGLLTSDAVSDPRFESRASVQAGQIRSALCSPLWDGERVLGAIYLDSQIQSYVFSREDLVLLNAIGNQIAIRLKQEQLNAELADERIVRSNLERYHSPDMVDAILTDARERGSPNLGMEERVVSVLFADISGFTPFAESLSPTLVADVLRDYYEIVTGAIFSQGGSVNEYLGDGVMGIFGAPVAQPDHARRAVEAGLEMMRRMSEATGAGAELFRRGPRIAINSGPVVVGSIGAPDRLKYAVIGDAVNVAARLEGMADANSILLGEETDRLLGESPAREGLGARQLRGRERPVRVYRIGFAANS